MKHPNKLVKLSLCLFMMLGGKVFAQPIDNPYITFYPQTPASHWTAVLAWEKVFSVSTFGAIPNDGTDDLAAIKQAIDAAAATPGGGIVYFPAGIWNVSDSLILKAGVVLRGETPTQNNAQLAGFASASKLEFPAYIFDTTANGGAGTDVNTAFKVITCRTDAQNIGVVNLDINRANIEFHPEFENLGPVTHAGGTNDNWQPKPTMRNVIVMGTRTNNVAKPSLSVPDVSGPNKMRPWQRFYNYFVSNIDVYATENVVIANNRINDATTDNFDQPGYKVRNQCTTCSNYKLVGQPSNNTWNADNFIPVLDGSHARFDYSAHYGIAINRDKKVIINGARTIQQYIWYPDPSQEPSLYAKGFRVEDNWIYKTNRVGIWCAGLGLVVRNNIIRDTAILGSTTTQTPKNQYLNNSGTAILKNFSATFENRGIDFGGGDITIEDNDLLVSACNFPEGGYGSIDGEGIMDQGNGGGTNPNGLIVRNNKIASNRNDCVNPTIGIYRTEGANNITYENNEFTGMSRCLQIAADRGNLTPLTNALVTNNRNVVSLIATSKGGGRNVVVHDNFGPTSGGSGSMTLSCFVREYSNTNLVLESTGCRAVLPNAVDTSVFPASKVVYPNGLLTLPVAPTIFTIKGVVVNGNPDSVVVYLDGTTRLGVATRQIDSLYYDWAMPSTDGQYKFMLRSYYTPTGGARNMDKSAFATLVIDDGNARTNNPSDVVAGIAEPAVSKAAARALTLYPNPAMEKLYWSISGNEQVQVLEITDLAGRKVGEYKNPFSGIGIETLPAGTYVARFTDTAGNLQKLFVKK